MALEIVRRRARHRDDSLYVTDAERRLTGILSLRDLVTSDPQARIGDVMTEEVLSVSTDTDQESGARFSATTSLPCPWWIWNGVRGHRHGG